MSAARNQTITSAYFWALLTSLIIFATFCCALGTNGWNLPLCVGFGSLRQCRCNETTLPKIITCTKAGFTFVPNDIPSSVVMLDLSSNNISELDEYSFGRLHQLEELILKDNMLERIHRNTFANNTRLKELSFENCGLIRIPSLPMQKLNQLTSLQLDRNEITTLERKDFQFTSEIRILRLKRNRLHSIPTDALEPLKLLTDLNLEYNQISSVPVHSFPKLSNLVTLSLKRNNITRVDDDAFLNLTSIHILKLDDNLLVEIPNAVTKLENLQDLSVSGNKIEYIPAGILQKTQKLARLELKGNPLKRVDPYAFSFLPNLTKLILADLLELNEFPNLNGTSALVALLLDNASLFSVPSNLCRTCPLLEELHVSHNKLARIPDLTECKNLKTLNLGNNYITSVDDRTFDGLAELDTLLLSHNLISEIPADAFRGLIKLEGLHLEYNAISYIHPKTFTRVPNLQNLNLGNNIFSDFPVAGLGKLVHLQTPNNPNLRVFPAPEHFPHIQSLSLSYAYHCCAFISLMIKQQSTTPSKILIVSPNKTESKFWSNRARDRNQTTEVYDIVSIDENYPNNFSMYGYSEEYYDNTESHLLAKQIQCNPVTGPFLPCQDLFDWWTLRCGVWVVFLLAILGNGTVVIVLIWSRSKCDVPRFLVCNLAAADLLMGIYLGILAVVDAYTLGEFRMHAVHWQYSGFCQFTGLLAVLSSEVSVYTLAVITLERNYAITHAMHLNKRLSLRHAIYIMMTGWAFALFFAILPFFGISDYRKYATCLPMEVTTGPWSVAYVVFLNFFNSVAFLILMGCYLKMYCAIRGSQAWNSNDSRIAKRMALLVFTDFLCFSPIAFFSLTAVAGYQLVTLEQAKVFTVFVLPLNSCCNPFLYAILTKQFKKDCVLICKYIEESRVTRGIGRCRHSSNFSNRQTPANTNSLVDRSSRENYVHGQPCTCSTKLLGEKSALEPKNWRQWLRHKFRRFLFCNTTEQDTRHIMRSDQYAYQIAEIQQKQHKRASSMSSSENYSSSRSDSWRQNHHHCGIPMRLLDPKRRALSWVVTRKTSQDSNLSSSRNDSSGSGNTASTSLSRISRSSASSDNKQPKPRLTRQSAVADEADLLVSPVKLTVRFLATIPSQTENSINLEDDNRTTYVVLHQSPEASPGNSPRSLSPCSQSRPLTPAPITLQKNQIN